MPCRHEKGKVMKNTLSAVLFGIIGMLISICPGVCQDANRPLDFTLPAPQETRHIEYLGVQAGTRFTLGQISGDMVIIEIFSMYCPICQKEASHVNELFDIIRQNPKLADRIKLLGIGAGNSAFEVDFFKKKYNIRFPLFADSDFSLHKQIGEVRTPHFFGLRLSENDAFDVFYSQSGEIHDTKKFLQMLINASGLDLTP